MAESKAREPRAPGAANVGSRKPRGAAARTLTLIAGAALGAVLLVSLAALTTGLPASSHHQAQRLARAAPRATPATRPSIRHSPARSRPSRGSVAPTTTNGSATSRSTLASVNAVVDESGSGRQKVISAINGVQSCSMSPTDGQAAISQVVNDRKNALDRLRQLSQSAGTGSPERPVIQSLVAVLNDSIEADQAYMAWMADIAAGQQHCGADPSGDANFTAGQTFSTKADGDKLVFVAAWNPLAGRDGLATYQPQDF